MTRPAVSQHLALLREAGLVDERRVSSQRLYVVRPEGFADIASVHRRVLAAAAAAVKLAAEAAERSKMRK